ncbi:MAG: nitroreductase family protein [Candidatus Omnitrophota bacterium]
MINFSEFNDLARRRRAIRHFQPDPIDKETLLRLLETAQWAPSGYNLQPTHYYAVTNEVLKNSLYSACFKQKQILEAPATIVFTGDRRVFENHFEKVIRMELETGAINEEYEKKLRQFVPLAFAHSPMGLGWFWKAALAPLLRLATPVPDFPAAHKRFWLAKQVLLNAMIFMLAATAEGLATVPMEGFDESRVKRALGIPRSHIVPVLIPVGYAVTADLKKTRLPLQDVLHWDRW